MTAYLLKATLSLLLAFGFYKLVLEKEQMPRFKRFYLLISLLFSVSIPFISLPIEGSVSPLINSQPEPLPNLAGLLEPTVTASPERTAVPYGWWLYCIVTALMLARFGRHGYLLVRQITASSRLPLGQATLVCLNQDTLPYTFLHYLFVANSAYQQGKIEGELFTHELAHIRQRHTLDVLLIEFLICFGWFHPLLYWYKQAIQLNHEFLADQAVNQRHQNVASYQQLLISKLTLSKRTSLTSTLTFKLTKKRLLMMTKQTSGIRTGLTGFGAMLPLVSLTVLLGSKSVLSQVPPASKATEQATSPQSSDNDVAQMEKLYGDKMVMLPYSPTRKVNQKKYSDLTLREKQQVRLIPPLPRLEVTESLLNDWKNAKKYGVWIDDKRVSNDQLNQYAAPDFGTYFSSKLAKNAINYGKHYYQIDLMTNQSYTLYLKEQEKNPFLVLVEHRLKSR